MLAPVTTKMENQALRLTCSWKIQTPNMAVATPSKLIRREAVAAGVERILNISTMGAKTPPTRTDAVSHGPVSYTHLRAHETRHDLVCRLLLEKKKKTKNKH